MWYSLSAILHYFCSFLCNRWSRDSWLPYPHKGCCGHHMWHVVRHLRTGCGVYFYDPHRSAWSDSCLDELSPAFDRRMPYNIENEALPRPSFSPRSCPEFPLPESQNISLNTPLMTQRNTKVTTLGLKMGRYRDRRRGMTPQKAPQKGDRDMS